MSLLSNSYYLNHNHSCEWDCCKSSMHTEINRDSFWNCLQQMKEREIFFRPSNRFICEKIIYLDNNRNDRSFLVIGFDPENKFDVCIRLEMYKTSSVMNSEQSKNFLEFLNEHESYIFQTSPFNEISSKFKLLLRQHKQRVFKLCMDGFSIKIDEEKLKMLCRQKSHIQRYITLLENEKEKYVSLFFKLMGHFYYGQTVKEVCELSTTDYKQYFFEELINFHCECLDKTFIMEMASNFENWFGKCMPYFIMTLMLNEKARLQSFSSVWPHEKEYVSTQQIAKSGLFYTGITDNVLCVFCGLVLHKWEAGDNPILDHCKYRPYCRFLMDPQSTLNISNVDGKEMEELLSKLAKERGNDGVDAV